MNSAVELAPTPDTAPFLVIHPLDDAPEAKVETMNAPPMHLTRSVRICLGALRGYLWLMLGLLSYWVLQLAGGARS